MLSDKYKYDMKDKYHMISLICGIQKKGKTNQTKNKQPLKAQRTNWWLPVGRWVWGWAK